MKSPKICLPKTIDKTTHDPLINAFDQNSPNNKINTQNLFGLNGKNNNTSKCQHLDLNRVDMDVVAGLESFPLVLTKLNRATLAQGRVFAANSVSCRTRCRLPFPTTFLLRMLLSKWEGIKTKINSLFGRAHGIKYIILICPSKIPIHIHPHSLCAQMG